MDIQAKINKKIKYLFNPPTLKTVGFLGFDINSCPTSCLVQHGKHEFGLSKWVSPKRSRSYPYGRVYDTLGYSKRITVIPVYKEEGKAGDRDYLQWDTVSLMSLLDVFVVLAYYSKAEKHSTRENKITNQQFDSEYVCKKLTEISEYQSSALDWNMREVSESLPTLVEKAKKSYGCISNKLDIELHGEDGIEKFQNKIASSVDAFMHSSRHKAKQAQQREFSTLQPKEHLQTDSKAKITITDYLGGCYYFTTDEIEIKGNQLLLIEAKHTKNTKLPSMADIKDGLLKMILYSNLENVTVKNHQYSPVPVLKLTSSIISGKITSQSSRKEIDCFIQQNQYQGKKKIDLEYILQEGRNNNILIRIEGV
ncbi:hypothetical protein MNBD_PLANCTO02-2495 [hydrothermal vent metagenome]|uniref:Uncharacterized protein n=1 Tax=hydrothermal vent metagenome TaxID=652676 RepID=A0A3B1DS62_9ZZZZ